MICKSCGTENAAEAVFCKNCGKSLAETTVNEAAPATPAPAMEETAYGAPEAPVTPAPAPAKKGMSLAALILGIAGVVLSGLCGCLCGCLGGTPGAICAALAIVFGVLSMNKAKQAGLQDKQAKIGMILGIAGVVLFILALIINAVLGGVLAASGAFEEFNYYGSYNW